MSDFWFFAPSKTTEFFISKFVRFKISFDWNCCNKGFRTKVHLDVWRGTPHFACHTFFVFVSFWQSLKWKRWLKLLRWMLWWDQRSQHHPVESRKHLSHEHQFVYLSKEKVSVSVSSHRLAEPSRIQQSSDTTIVMIITILIHTILLCFLLLAWFVPHFQRLEQTNTFRHYWLWINGRRGGWCLITAGQNAPDGSLG